MTWTIPVPHDSPLGMSIRAKEILHKFAAMKLDWVHGEHCLDLLALQLKAYEWVKDCHHGKEPGEV